MGTIKNHMRNFINLAIISAVFALEGQDWLTEPVAEPTTGDVAHNVDDGETHPAWEVSLAPVVAHASQELANAEEAKRLVADDIKQKEASIVVLEASKLAAGLSHSQNKCQLHREHAMKELYKCMTHSYTAYTQAEAAAPADAFPGQIVQWHNTKSVCYEAFKNGQVC